MLTRPPSHNRPQTRLLTALALLIAAATLMLACGPAVAPAPAEGNALPAAQQADGNGAKSAAELEEPTATATPVPTVCVQWESAEERIEYCFTPEPEATPKYPNLSDHRLVEMVEKFEKAQQSVGSASGQAAEGESVVIEIWIYLLPDQVDIVSTWLGNNSVSGFERWDDAIHAWVPVSLLGPLSQQSGVRSVEMPREPAPTVVW